MNSTRRTALAWLLMVLGSALPGRAGAQEIPASDTRRATKGSPASGLAVAAGLGHSYGSLLGVQLSYAFAAPGSHVAAAPFVAVGYFPDIDAAEGRGSGTLGVMGYWGMQHRWVGEVAYGTLTMRSLTLHGSTVAIKPAYGLSLCSGYEFLSEAGLFLRALLGGGVVLDTEPAQATALLSLGLGWKF